MKEDKPRIKNCIFCNIIKNKTEPFLYEDRKLVVLPSKYPTSKGHLLIIPKKHYENLDQISERDYLHLHEIVKKFHKKLNNLYKPEKIYIILLAEEISHIHFHLIPRYKGDKRGLEFLLKKKVKIKNQEAILNDLK